MNILYILLFVLVLGLIVLVHEFGHFLFAKRAGILCHEFSIGMGPALYKKKVGETVYALRAIPLGGYVSAAGEDPELARIKVGQTVYLEMKNNQVEKIHFVQPNGLETKEAVVSDFDLYGKEGNTLFIEYESEGSKRRVQVKRDAMYVFEKGEEFQIAPYDRCYEAKPWFSRFLFVVMGAGFNFILATLIFIIFYLVQGIPTNEPVISDPTVDRYTSGAEAAGLNEGDRILKIGNKEIKVWDDISSYMANDYQGGPLQITIDRNGSYQTITLTPTMAINTIGIISDLNPSTETIVGGINANSVADKEGLKAGDRIKEVNGVVVTNWLEMRQEFSKYYKGDEIKITYERNGVTRTIDISPLKVPVDYDALEKNPEAVEASIERIVGNYSIGISPKMEFRFFTSIGLGFKETFYQIGSVFQTIGLLIGNNNVGVSDLSGPVGIFDMTKTTAMAGFMSLLFWVGFISANIGFVNLLPLPALDGGRLIFLFLEGIFRRPINRKVEGYIHNIGFILFMLLFIYITFNDILRLRG